MEAHRVLALRGYSVRSYGTGSSVKLPGPSADQPVIFPFNMAYEEMRKQLVERDGKLYESNGVLAMLDRNAKIKKAPEHWKEARDKFDVIVTFEERVFRAVVEDFICNRSPVAFMPAYVVNLQVKDTHADAAIGGKWAVQLVEKLDALENVDKGFYGVIAELEKWYQRDIMAVPVFC